MYKKDPCELKYIKSIIKYMTNVEGINKSNANTTKFNTNHTRSPHTYQICTLKMVNIIINQIPTVKHIHHTNTKISKVTLKLLLCLCILFYSSFVYTCVCVFLHIQSLLRECRSIRSGASGLPYYCAPLVCVSEVIELLAVWWHNKPKSKKNMTEVCTVTDYHDRLQA